MAYQDLEQAKTRIATLLKQGEKLEWVDTFRFRTVLTRQFYGLLTVALTAVFFWLSSSYCHNLVWLTQILVRNGFSRGSLFQVSYSTL